MTKNAAHILELIQSSDNHPTAEQIYDKLRENSCKMALATVYNNLAYLSSQGLIRKISVEGWPDRYDKIIKHDHLICKKCGRLADIKLKDLTEPLQLQMEDEVLFYDLKIGYLCPVCREKGKNPF